MATTTTDQHLAEALRARQAGRAADARGHFEAVLAIDPDQPLARNALGMEALASGDAAAAAAHFERACRADPGAAPLWLNLAKAHRLLDRHEDERAALEQVLTLDQTDLMALIRLAQLHERLGEEPAAVERWGAVLALSANVGDPSPEFAELVAHARAYVDQRTQKLADALEAALAGDLAKATPRDRRRITAATGKLLSRRAVYFNECHGMHYPFLPADEYFDREHFPWLGTLEAAAADIRAEVEAILAERDPGLSPYVTMAPGTPASKWSALDGSADWSALHLWREGERIDEACARAPMTAALVESLPLCRIEGRAPTVFFSILKAGKHIPPHTGVTNIRTIVHLPLIVPDGCRFRVGGETRPWVEGEAFAFDDTIEHEAWNPTDRDRAVLILDCWNPYLSGEEQDAVRRIYAVADAQRGDGIATGASVRMRSD